MPRPKKDVVKVTYTIDKDIVEKIDNYNIKTDIPKSKIVEQAIREFITAKEKEAAK